MGKKRYPRPRFILLLLVLTCVTLLTIDGAEGSSGPIEAAKGFARGIFRPIRSGVDSATKPIGNVLQGILHYDDLKEENDRLRDQLEATEADRIKADDAERERRALLDAANINFLGDIPTVSARVVSYASSNFELSIEIDKGRNDGITDGMPVVTGAGLVGRVAGVSANRATVSLVTDPTFDVGVRLATSGDIGVAKGEGKGKALRVDMIDPATKVERAEALVTSGLGQSAFPPGIPVGKVSKVGKPSGGTATLQKEMFAKPIADLSHLGFVQILIWEPNQQAPAKAPD